MQDFIIIYRTLCILQEERERRGMSLPDKSPFEDAGTLDFFGRS
jgi:hypothetical protein